MVRGRYGADSKTRGRAWLTLTNPPQKCYNTRQTSLPKWRNWQTQQTQNLPLATTCRFDPGLRHHSRLCHIGIDFPKSERDTLRDFLTIYGIFQNAGISYFRRLDRVYGNAYIRQKNFSTDTERKVSIGALLHRAIAHIRRVSARTGILLGRVLSCERLASYSAGQVPS